MYVAEERQEMTPAEAIALLEQDESALLEGVMKHKRQSVMTKEDFESRHNELEHPERYVETFCDSVLTLDPGVLKLLRRAGVLFEDECLQDKLVEFIQSTMKALLCSITLRLHHVPRSHIEAGDVVATKVTPH